MQNVILVIHLLLAIGLVGVVLLQRSEGGGLGIGGRLLSESTGLQHEHGGGCRRDDSLWRRCRCRGA